MPEAPCRRIVRFGVTAQRCSTTVRRTVVRTAIGLAIGLLRASDLTAAYEETWQVWSDSGDESLWDAAVGDGIA